MSSKSLTTSSDKLNLVHAEYVSNGFNGTKAVQEVYKDMNYQSARVYFNTIRYCFIQFARWKRYFGWA